MEQPPEDGPIEDSPSEDKRVSRRREDDRPVDDEPIDDEESFSLDDLGAAYARAMVESGLLPETPPAEPEPSGTDRAGAELGAADDAARVLGGEGDDVEDEHPLAISPAAIVEAALFIGHPDNRPLTASQIAATMRGVSADEVEEIVDELNAAYDRDGHAFRIHRRDGGLWFGLSEEMRGVRSAFYGKVRETRLTQAAIDVLALVAYQPGVTAKELTAQRGKDCSAIVNQMVRRELLEIRREKREGVKAIPALYPTTRLMNLLGLRSLDDLPQVDEADVAPRR